jgi:hypothetical protein
MDEIKLNESSNINDDYKKVFSPTIVDDRKTKKASNMKKGGSKNKGN